MVLLTSKQLTQSGWKKKVRREAKTSYHKGRETMSDNTPDLDDEGYLDLNGPILGTVITPTGEVHPAEITISVKIDNETKKAIAAFRSNLPVMTTGVSISFPVEITPESDAAFQVILTELARREAEFTAERAGQITRFFNDVKGKSLRNGSADYRKLRADVREFIKAVGEVGTGTGVDAEKCCMYLKNAAITGLIILAEHRPDKITYFQEELMRFCEAHAPNWFKEKLWGDLFAWASFFENLMNNPPAGLFYEWSKDAEIKELNDVEIFVNYLLLACLSRVGNGL